MVESRSVDMIRVKVGSMVVSKSVVVIVSEDLTD